MGDHITAKSLLESSRDHQKKLHEKFKESSTSQRVEIPKVLEGRNIVGQTQIIDSNGKQQPVFIEKVDFLSDTNQRNTSVARDGSSEFAYVALSKEGNKVGNIGLSSVGVTKQDDVYLSDPRPEEDKIKLDTLELDWIDTLEGKKYFGDNQKGLGSGDFPKFSVSDTN